jgi:hypothetical protein
MVGFESQQVCRLACASGDCFLWFTMNSNFREGISAVNTDAACGKCVGGFAGHGLARLIRLRAGSLKGSNTEGTEDRPREVTEAARRKSNGWAAGIERVPRTYL